MQIYQNKKMSKTQYQQYYKRNTNNNTNNYKDYKDYNNNTYYNNNNYYYNYNYKKTYQKNNTNLNGINNYNEERKKNNYYNYIKLPDTYNEYNDEYGQYDEFNEYNGYNNGYNDYIYPSNKRKKVHRYNNKNYYDNNEEIKSKTVNEIKHKKELIKLKINIKENKYKELIIYKDDDINKTVSQFCNDNFISDKLIEPLCNKIKKSLLEINYVSNNMKLDKDSILMFEKAKKLMHNK